jgi:predicted DNA-binding transcriptional regulator AlpA
MDIDNLLQKDDRTLFLIRSIDLQKFAETIIAGVSREPSNEPEKPISQNEAVEFLGKSRQTFYSWRRKGLISAHPLGGRVFYYRSELQDALNRRR